VKLTRLQNSTFFGLVVILLALANSLAYAAGNVDLLDGFVDKLITDKQK